MTRPEISVHVNLLGRHAQKPTTVHLQSAYRVLSYLISTQSEGLKLRKPLHLDVKIYVDASYGGPKARSQSGTLITLGEQPVGWYSRRQDVVAISVTEAEYIAGCEGAKDAAWMEQFLAELNIRGKIPYLITDSEGSYNLAKTAKFLRRSRHIEHRYHYLRQQVKKEHIVMNTIPGKDNPADILTKLLPMSSIKTWKNTWLASIGTIG